MRLGPAAILARSARSIAEGALDLLYPWRCLVCGEADAPGAVPGLCPECTRSLPWRLGGAGGPVPVEVGRELYAAIVVALRFEAPVDELVYQLKYGGERAAALPLAFALAESVKLARPPLIDLPDVLVPVPMHWLKRLGRGIDHARELGEELGRALKRPVAAAALQRRRATVAQAQASNAAQRQIQVKGAFRAGRSIRGRHVGLVDDVVTSGATAAACAAALLDAGARAVTLLAAAGNG